MTDNKQFPWWQCGECGHTMQENEPPEVCPSCNKKCQFKNVSCYTPECDQGGPDSKLLGGGK